MKIRLEDFALLMLSGTATNKLIDIIFGFDLINLILAPLPALEIFFYIAFGFAGIWLGIKWFLQQRVI